MQHLLPGQKVECLLAIVSSIGKVFLCFFEASEAEMICQFETIVCIREPITVSDHVMAGWRSNKNNNNNNNKWLAALLLLPRLTTAACWQHSLFLQFPRLQCSVQC